MTIRIFCLPLFAVMMACGPSGSPVPQAKSDPTAEAWYGQTVRELAQMNHQADEFFRKGKQDDAAALIEKGEPMSLRLLSVSKPTLAATEAASDLDQLYGQMLFSNHHYGWARLLFQRNVARWKTWKPETTESARRLKLAQDAIADCDRHITQ